MWIVRHPAPGSLHHVIVQFIDRDYLITDDVTRRQYLTMLGRALADSDWRCLAYALMSNHIHLGMVAGRTPADRWMRRVHPPFVAWLNRRLDRIGPLFAASPAIWVVHRDRELRLIAYIHNNPVRAGVVRHARDSTWTSHRAYLMGACAPWLSVDEGLARVGVSAAELDTYADEHVGHKLERGEQARIHRAARTLGAIEVGTPVDAPRQTTPLLRRPYGYLAPNPWRLVEIVADVLGVPAMELRSRRPSVFVSGARSLAIYCGRTAGLSISSIAATFGISPQAGSRLGLQPLSDVDIAAARVVMSRVEEELADFVRASHESRELKNGKGS